MKEVLIDDEIGYNWWDGSGVTLKSVQEQLKGIEDGEDIQVTVNSPGGSVYEGIVIFNLLRDYAKSHPVSTHINCMAMSMASYIALAARTVNKNAKVTVSENSVFMIHNPWGVSIGDYHTLNKDAEYFEKLAAVYGSVHAAVSGKSEKEIRAAMDDETFYVGKEIVDNGFANDFETISKNEEEGISASARDNIIINAKFASNKTMEKAREAKAKNPASYRGDLEKAVALFTMPKITPAASAALTADAKPGEKTVSGGYMNPEELMAKDKALYDAVFALGKQAGVDAERARVNAHLLLGKKAGSLDLAAKYIEAGASAGDEMAQAEYFAANMDAKNLAARMADNPPDVQTGGEAGMGGNADDAKAEAAFLNGFAGKDSRGQSWAE